ncbi:tRNA-specific adenosine deaminase 2 [Nematocida parisii]|nr:tRNA-specific adenosine deaminase 2 [Nematocida parisii]
MEIAMEEARRALVIDEVPIGCAVFYRGECIDRSHNLTNTLKDPLAHAEMISLQRIPADILAEVELYVTCEPCIMCLALIIKLRIKKVIYSCCNPRFGGLSVFIEQKILTPHKTDEVITSLSTEENALNTSQVNTNSTVNEVSDTSLTSNNSSTQYLYAMNSKSVEHSVEMCYIPDEEAISLLKEFYTHENIRAPTEKRKYKTEKKLKIFKNGTGE